MRGHTNHHVRTHQPTREIRSGGAEEFEQHIHLPLLVVIRPVN